MGDLIALRPDAALPDRQNRPDEACLLWIRLLTLNPEAMAPNGTPIKDLIAR